MWYKIFSLICNLILGQWGTLSGQPCVVQSGPEVCVPAAGEESWLLFMGFTVLPGGSSGGHPVQVYHLSILREFCEQFSHSCKWKLKSYLKSVWLYACLCASSCWYVSVCMHAFLNVLVCIYVCIFIIFSLIIHYHSHSSDIIVGLTFILSNNVCC